MWSAPQATVMADGKEESLQEGSRVGLIEIGGWKLMTQRQTVGAPARS